MDDGELLSLLISDPADGIQTAVSQYGGIAKAAAVRILGRDHHEIDECVSDTFFKLWNSAKNAKPPVGGVKSYIAAVARNTAIDVYRKQKSAPQLTPLDDTFEADYDLEDEYARAENAKIVKECVENLPEPDRTVFLRRYYLGERVKDIAHLTGLGSKQVENILHRGKKKLEHSLLERGVTK